MQETRIVAVIGASSNRSKFGNRAVRAYRSAGWTVYPVHLSATAIEGIPSYRSIEDVPEAVHRATVYLPPDRVFEVLPGVARKAVQEMYLNPGADSPAVVARARELGIPVVLGCSIVDIGQDPAHPD